jgi:hypothetical protein
MKEMRENKNIRKGISKNENKDEGKVEDKNKRSKETGTKGKTR